MKISKGAIITIIFALSIISVIVCAIIDGDSNPYPNTTKYLKDAFNKNEYGVKIIDSEKGEDITDSFISKKKNFTKMEIGMQLWKISIKTIIIYQLKLIQMKSDSDSNY